jgi:hypothetical protein
MYTESELRKAFSSGVVAGMEGRQARSESWQSAQFVCESPRGSVCSAEMRVHLILPLSEAYWRGVEMGQRQRRREVTSRDVQARLNETVQRWRRPLLVFAIQQYEPVRRPADPAYADQDEEFWSHLTYQARGDAGSSSKPIKLPDPGINNEVHFEVGSIVSPNSTHVILDLEQTPARVIFPMDRRSHESAKRRVAISFEVLRLMRPISLG